MKILHRVALLLGCAFALSGCSAAADAPAGTGGQAPSAAGGSTAGEDLNVELKFEPSDGVALAPRQQHRVTVVVTPPAAHTVRFALVDARDAALDKSSLVTEVNGRGSAQLTAPSTLGDFSLRAQLGSRSAVLYFSVSARSVAAIEVVPRYSGRRPVTEWVASVHIDERCADLGPIVADSTTLFARIAADKTATIPNVALGSPIAVTVRAGQFAAGCTDVSATEARESVRVEVRVADRPLDLPKTELEVALGVGANDPTFAAAIDSGLAAVRSAFLGDGSSAPTALLDAMEQELEPSLQPAFRTARAELGWDATVAQRNPGVNQLTDQITSWVTIGQSALFSQRAFEGRLGADPAQPNGNPALRIDRIAELQASEVTADVTMTGWTADASDTLTFSGVLTWQHGQLITALAEAPALAGAGVTDVPSALAAVASCDGVANVLMTGDAPEAAALEAVCNAACLAAACRDALATMWDRAAAEGSTASLTLAAASIATIGNQAQATAIDGDWVGKLTLDSMTSDTTGSVHGAAPRYSAR